MIAALPKDKVLHAIVLDKLQHHKAVLEVQHLRKTGSIFANGGSPQKPSSDSRCAMVAGFDGALLSEPEQDSA